MNHAIDIAPLGPLADPAAIVRLGRAAERSGWDGLSIWDGLGVSMGTDAADPFVALTAVAMGTGRIRLITSVIAVARRRPQLVVQAAASLDRISEGRLVLGLGAGDDELDFTAFDDAFERPARIARMDEGIAIIDALLRGETLDHAGEAFAVHGVAVGPRPKQVPRPPLWLGGMRPGALRRAAALDGWIAIGVSEDGTRMELTPERFGSMVRTVERHRRELGMTGSPYATAILGYASDEPGATVRDFEAAGATWWLESLSPMRGSLDELEVIVEQGPPR